MSLHSKTVAELRVEYSLRTFDEQDALSNPFEQFDLWLGEAIAARVNEPNAMTLATVKEDGGPAARIVLLKGVNSEGFVFFTNYLSHKGAEIEKESRVALVFCWLELQRQVRIEGVARKIGGAESDAYFHSRPMGSRIGAHASPQSQVIAHRSDLERKYKELEELFSKEPVMRPEHWGGYCVVPTLFEFWQGRASRLHDRLLYSPGPEGWKIERLAP